MNQFHCDSRLNGRLATFDIFYLEGVQCYQWCECDLDLAVIRVVLCSSAFG